ncbi:MAG TPA: helix-turn-helix domain-containing protein [Patescibacteria group bacterium]|nr:helix-turn-helix domain-containing protein [Patescibacteria group bacterium]
MPRSRKPDDGPHPVDVHVGQRVKGRRLSLGLSQDDLAKACGITFQQVQKYERGTNRISVSRLTEIAQALKTSLEYFVDGLSTLLPGTAKGGARGFAESKQAPFESEPESRDEIELLRSYRAIKSPKTRKQVREMAQALAATGSDD